MLRALQGTHLPVAPSQASPIPRPPLETDNANRGASCALVVRSLRGEVTLAPTPRASCLLGFTRGCLPKPHALLVSSREAVSNLRNLLDVNLAYGRRS